MTSHDGLCFCMLQYDTAYERGGFESNAPGRMLFYETAGGDSIMKEGFFNQTLLDQCFYMTLHDERGEWFKQQMPLDLGFYMTLHDERGRRFNPMLWALYFRIL